MEIRTRDNLKAVRHAVNVAIHAIDDDKLRAVVRHRNHAVATNRAAYWR